MKLVHEHSPRRRRAGWTLVELMVASAISTVVMGVVVIANISISRAMVATANYNDMNQSGRNALDLLSYDVRNAEFVTNYSATALTLVNTFSNRVAITYSWDGSNNLLRTEGGGAARTLLKRCYSLNFRYFLRVPQAGLQFVEATNVSATNSIKLISVRWVCDRTILGSAMNSENVQTANIVIRN